MTPKHPNSIKYLARNSGLKFQFSFIHSSLLDPLMVLKALMALVIAILPVVVRVDKFDPVNSRDLLDFHQ